VKLVLTLNTWKTVAGVAFRATNAFSTAETLEGTSVKVGSVSCGSITKEINEQSWLVVACDDPVTTKTVEITSSSEESPFAVSQIEIILPKD
jgi:hypothetical protein